jgi:hypothetical protein
MVSGDWARHPDTVLRLEKDGQNPATKLTLEKARPADPAELGVPMLLEWVVESFGYRRRELNEGPRHSDNELVEAIYAELGTRPVGMTALLAAVGHDRNRVRAIIERELESGRIRNISTRNRYFELVIAETAASDSSDSIDSPVENEQTRINTGLGINETAPSIPPNDADPPIEGPMNRWTPRTPEGSIDHSSVQSDDDSSEDDPWTF